MLQCICLSSFMVLQFLKDPVGEESLAVVLGLASSRLVGVMELGVAETTGGRGRVTAIVVMLVLAAAPRATLIGDTFY